MEGQNWNFKSCAGAGRNWNGAESNCLIHNW